MIRDALFLARKDLRYMFRTKETWLWTFVMPVVFFYFIGSVTRGMGPSTAVERIGFSAPADAGFLADHFVRRIEALGYRVDRVPEAQLAGYSRRILVPPGFTATVLAGQQARIEWKHSGSGVAGDYDEIRIQRAAYTLLADVIAIRMSGQTPTPETIEKLSAEPRRLTLEVKAAGARRRVPLGFEQAVPGTMVMFVLLVMFTLGGVSIHQERQLGILRRLASSPMSRGAVVLGKLGSRLCLGMIQIAFAMITGTLLFGVDWGPNLAALIPVLLAYGALTASLGLLLGNVGRTEGQVIGLGVVASNVMAALGGCWWPIEITPLWTQKLALALPTGWAMDALHKLVSFGAPPLAVLPHIVVLVLAAAVAAWVMSRTLRFL